MSSITSFYAPLVRDFYARPSDEAAVDLLGKILVRRVDHDVMAAKIVEVEAYFGYDDPASHACRGMTRRNAIMFGPPGFAYVYLNYGVHWLLNAVTESEGTAGAVLIRAVEAIEGIDRMLENRPVGLVHELGSGPGKLTKAMLIGPEENGLDLTDGESELYIAHSDEEPVVGRSARVGISSGQERMLRFFINGSEFISKKI